VVCNWVWYQNIAPGDRLTDLFTDRNGVTAELTVPPGSVQNWHTEQLHSAAEAELPTPLAEVVRRTAEPFIQAIVDLVVSRMGFGRSCLIGDAAFVLRPHIGVGTAKAADDARQLGNALLDVTARDVPDRLKAWETQQLPVARRALKRARGAGRSLQEGTWRVGELPRSGFRCLGTAFCRSAYNSPSSCRSLTYLTMIGAEMCGSKRPGPAAGRASSAAAARPVTPTVRAGFREVEHPVLAAGGDVLALKFRFLCNAVPSITFSRMLSSMNVATSRPSRPSTSSTSSRAPLRSSATPAPAGSRACRPAASSASTWPRAC
jgi:hypothetical protein